MSNYLPRPYRAGLPSLELDLGGEIWVYGLKFRPPRHFRFSPPPHQHHSLTTFEPIEREAKGFLMSEIFIIFSSFSWETKGRIHFIFVAPYWLSRKITTLFRRIEPSYYMVQKEGEVVIWPREMVIVVGKEDFPAADHPSSWLVHHSFLFFSSLNRPGMLSFSRVRRPSVSLRFSPEYPMPNALV